ncbi:plastocyanin/azurin family copper-binding protein [Halolamina sp.]|jgi:plastocyanin|uniref:plastocyanin/azurin family copper-binding protein n=1 Tax=Halolamina sp. TaxID=1940283 RepID=UPI000223B907|nr:blue (type 1) copper domain protein [halophilic archaeon DL31]
MDDRTDVNRRTALRAAAGLVAAGTVGLAGCSGDGGSPGNTVLVGPEQQLVFEPAELTVTVGEELTWTWESDGHNVVPSGQPSDADWSGTEGGESKLYDEGHEYTHTFETAGRYNYVCTPHKSAGMTGTVIVQNE